ncbi:hypothetical protein VN24_14300 [Paenibacillus beijingensis]|uniref:Uncharacterized protein n=1 Tax=Paenibacillus beijingensis TaxID=1126833 RepID=A0A0D5NJS3_9BACL|nr:hypothetical protein VN24_14300 [Paenibacillus beijingensis]
MRYEWSRGWAGVLATLLFATYMVFTTLPLFNYAGELDQGYRVVIWAGDFSMLVVLPCLGFLMNRTTLRYLREDYVTRRIAYWRTLPITNRHIAAARLIMMMTVLVPLWLYFFTLEYIVAKGLRSMLTVPEFTGYALFWLGYAVIVSVTYAYWEVGYSGRTFFIICFVYVGLFVAVSCIVAMNGGSIIFAAAGQFRSGHWWLAGLSLAAGAAALALGSGMIRRRLETRSLTNER